MSEFFTKSQTVAVSQMTPAGWWLRNTQEHVAKGTALGDDFTQDIYTPSEAGKTACYDRKLRAWSQEIDDMTFKPYFDKHGREYAIGVPDGDYPEWAIKDAPPVYNRETQTVLHSDDGWQVFDMKLGEPYYDEFGFESLITVYNFTLPVNHTWEAPPEAPKGFAPKLVKGTWQTLRDLRGEMAYAKDRDHGENYIVAELGELPETHTEKPYGDFDSWDDAENDWVYDIERHRPVMAQAERAWRNDQLSAVLNRIDQYQSEQTYPETLRTSPIKSEQAFLLLLQDRKALSDYPSCEGFPFGERPQLSGLSH
ncbi:hypothetical protein [Vibrio furnissii]|uniref:hypothetical protein n=1 Tax=Vibrio furnissii TaxID=29494 RepID=UPI001559ACAD|nr:hypothetical protein [Vibrio furnissii]